MENLKKIKMLILDVDGVLTRGEIAWSSRGEELKIFNVIDGMGLKLLEDRGIKVVVISGRSSSSTDLRMRDLEISEVYQGVKDKLALAKSLSSKHGIPPEEICFIGDDVNDIPLMMWVGFPVAVRNAVKEVRKIARYITTLEGGKGAVREVVDLIIALSG